MTNYNNDNDFLEKEHKRLYTIVKELNKKYGYSLEDNGFYFDKDKERFKRHSGEIADPREIIVKMNFIPIFIETYEPNPKDFAINFILVGGNLNNIVNYLWSKRKEFLLRWNLKRL